MAPSGSIGLSLTDAPWEDVQVLVLHIDGIALGHADGRVMQLELYVTAVRLTNKRKKAQVLDPRTLRGQWLAATYQHARLLPAGDEADTTAVYLISSQPFESSF